MRSKISFPWSMIVYLRMTGYLTRAETLTDSKSTSNSDENECEDDIELYIYACGHATFVRYPDPLGFLSKIYFSFNEASYKLMVDDILGILNITPDKLKVTNNGTPIDLRTWIVNEEEAFSTTR